MPVSDLVSCQFCREYVVPKDGKCPKCDSKLNLESKVKAVATYLDLGNSYIVKERKIDSSMEMFKALLEKGFSGLCITGTFPKKLRNQYGLGTVKFIWLSTTEGKEAAYNPKRLDFEITDAVSEFVKSNKKPVILLDGIELLVLSNGFEKVVEFVKLVSDLTAQYDGIFLLPINPVAFEEHKLATLEQNLEVIQIPEKERQERLMAELNVRKREEEIERLRLETEEKEREKKKAEMELRMKEEDRRKLQLELMAKEEERIRAEHGLKIAEEERKKTEAELAAKEEERKKQEIIERIEAQKRALMDTEFKLRLLIYDRDNISGKLKDEDAKLLAEIERRLAETVVMKCHNCQTPVKMEHFKRYLENWKPPEPAAPHETPPPKPPAMPQIPPPSAPSKPVEKPAPPPAPVPKPPEPKGEQGKMPLSESDIKRIEKELDASKKREHDAKPPIFPPARPLPPPAKPADEKQKEEIPKVQHTCPVCKQKLVYFPQYDKWNCDKCNKWFAIKFEKDKQ